MKTIGIIANPHKADATLAVREAQRLLARHRVSLLLEKQTARLVGQSAKGVVISKLIENSDLLVVLGGDGTMLRVARELGGKAIPILGVNLGSLGFLTSIPREQMKRAIADVLSGRFDVTHRRMLQVRVKRGTRVVSEQFALNDAVLSRSDISRAMRVVVSVNGFPLANYVCDGVILATPTGSTAYSMSARGPVLSPDLAAYVVTPICPHPLNHPPLVLRSDTAITVATATSGGRPLLTVDGQVQLPLCWNDYVEVCGSSRTVPLVTLRQRTYYHVLREKLKWINDTP